MGLVRAFTMDNQENIHLSFEGKNIFLIVSLNITEEMYETLRMEQNKPILPKKGKFRVIYKKIKFKSDYITKAAIENGIKVITRELMVEARKLKKRVLTKEIKRIQSFKKKKVMQYFGQEFKDSVTHLVTHFGPPTGGQNNGFDKVNFEWELKTPFGINFLIINYRMGRSIKWDEIVSWHILAGSSWESFKAWEWVKGVLGEPITHIQDRIDEALYNEFFNSK